jgi:hypothetical protein
MRWVGNIGGVCSKLDMKKSYTEKIIEGADSLSKRLLLIRGKRLEFLKRQAESALNENEFVSHYKDRFYLAAIVLCLVIFFCAHGFLFYFSYSVIPTYKDQYQCTICNDGHVSYSHNQGACSWHDGVARYVYRKVEDTHKQVFTLEYGVSLLIATLLLGGLAIYSKATLKITLHTINWFSFSYLVLLLWSIYFMITFVLIFLMPVILAAFALFYFLKFFIVEEITKRLFKRT